jgi:hypothetical protein
MRMLPTNLKTRTKTAKTRKKTTAKTRKKRTTKTKKKRTTKTKKKRTTKTKKIGRRRNPRCWNPKPRLLRWTQRRWNPQFRWPC